MPEWSFGVYDPAVGDEEIVARITGGDPEGLGEAYDKYAPALYGYCASRLCQPAEAEDVVQDTFLIAAQCLAQLRDPSRLCPWLYAVARNECVRRQRTREIPAAQVPETAGTEDVTSVIEDAELAALVRDAVAGAGRDEQEVLALQLQGLNAGETALVLGIPRKHLHTLASRARKQLSVCLGVLLVARTGRSDCAALGRILDGWDGRLTPGLRRQLARHLEHCAVCGTRRSRELTPSILAGVAVPLAAAVPGGLRRQVLHAATSADPAARLYRAGVVKHAGQFADHGFPARLAVPRLWHHASAAHAGAAAAVTVTTGAAVVALAGGGPVRLITGTPVPPAATIHLPAATATAGKTGHGPRTTGPASPGAAPVAATSPAAGPSATRSHRPGMPSPSPSPSPSVSSTATVSPSPSQTPPPLIQGTLTVSPGALTLVPLLGATITLTAAGGPVTWSVSEPASLLGSVAVSPSSGTLQAGQSATVTVALSSVLSVASSLTVSPGGEVVTILAGAGLLGGL
jgi:RNA polymerase sigma factor (sigma-70 family)